MSHLQQLWEVTGGFFISASGDNYSIYLVTAWHVVLPTKEGNQLFVHKNNSQAHTDIVILSQWWQSSC
jgi:hypothetical protein